MSDDEIIGQIIEKISKAKKPKKVMEVFYDTRALDTIQMQRIIGIMQAEDLIYLGYENQFESRSVFITEKGKKISYNGGYFVVKTKEKIKNEKRNIEKIEAEIRMSHWTYKHRCLPYIASTFSLIVSIVTLIKLFFF